MRGSQRNLLWMVVYLGAIGCAGCADLTPVKGPDWWPFPWETPDVVPGVTPPAERIALLRKMGEKAAWAKPAEQERISGELAAAFQVEADPLIRIEIVRAVSGYPTTAAKSVLDAAIKDSDADVRLVACRAWGRRGGAEAVAKLSEVLSSDMDTDVRLTALKALGETGDARAVAALGEALEERDPATQYQAMQSLRKVTNEDFGNDVGRWRQYVKGEVPDPAKPVSIAEQFRRWF